jgi:hypothetical protein
LTWVKPVIKYKKLRCFEDEKNGSNNRRPAVCGLEEFQPGKDILFPCAALGTIWAFRLQDFPPSGKRDWGVGRSADLVFRLLHIVKIANLVVEFKRL